jgi:phosphoribosyl 1,2-cyclic phosphodiesterase
MTLKILNSSSAGNCYIFDSGKEALVVEAGVPFTEVKKALNFDISRIVGVLLSHEHADHAGHVKGFLRARIPVYASCGTIVAIEGCVSRPKMNILLHKEPQRIGSFAVMPFDVQHDAAEPFGFLLYHPDMGGVLFATDTYYMRYTAPGLSNILIECNYRQDILDENTRNGSLSAAQRKRTIMSHMSYETCLEALLANDLKAVNNIVLIHLSDANSNADEFRQGVASATGKTVHVAQKGMEIAFNKTPF